MTCGWSQSTHRTHLVVPCDCSPHLARGPVVLPRTVYILVAQSNESHPFSIRTWADNGAMTMTALLAGDLAARKVPCGGTMWKGQHARCPPVDRPYVSHRPNACCMWDGSSEGCHRAGHHHQAKNAVIQARTIKSSFTSRLRRPRHSSYMYDVTPARLTRRSWYVHAQVPHRG